MAAKFVWVGAAVAWLGMFLPWEAINGLRNTVTASGFGVAGLEDVQNGFGSTLLIHRSYVYLVPACTFIGALLTVTDTQPQEVWLEVRVLTDPGPRRGRAGLLSRLLRELRGGQTAAHRHNHQPIRGLDRQRPWLRAHGRQRRGRLVQRIHRTIPSIDAPRGRRITHAACRRRRPHS